MAIDPNIPPTGRDRLNNPNVPHSTATTTRSGSSGWMIGLVVCKIARNFDPTPKVFQCIDLVAKD